MTTPFLQCDEWHRILEQNAEVGTVFFDLKKAFDTLPHIGLSYIASMHGPRLSYPPMAGELPLQ